MLRYAVLLALAGVALAEIPKIPCAGNIGDRYFPSDIRSNHCTTELCSISQRENIEFEIDANVPFDTPYLNVHGYMYFKLPDGFETGIPIPFPEEVMDGCQSLVRGSCPLAAGEAFTTRVFWDWTEVSENVEVDTRFEMEFRIYDDNEIVATCFRVPVVVTA